MSATNKENDSALGDKNTTATPSTCTPMKLNRREQLEQWKRKKEKGGPNNNDNPTPSTSSFSLHHASPFQTPVVHAGVPLGSHSRAPRQNNNSVTSNLAHRVASMRASNTNRRDILNTPSSRDSVSNYKLDATPITPRHAALRDWKLKQIQEKIDHHRNTPRKATSGATRPEGLEPPSAEQAKWIRSQKRLRRRLQESNMLITQGEHMRAHALLDSMLMEDGKGSQRSAFGEVLVTACASYWVTLARVQEATDCFEDVATTFESAKTYDAQPVAEIDAALRAFLYRMHEKRDRAARELFAEENGEFELGVRSLNEEMCEGRPLGEEDEEEDWAKPIQSEVPAPAISSFTQQQTASMSAVEQRQHWELQLRMCRILTTSVAEIMSIHLRQNGGVYLEQIFTPPRKIQQWKESKMRTQQEMSQCEEQEQSQCSTPLFRRQLLAHGRIPSSPGLLSRSGKATRVADPVDEETVDDVEPNYSLGPTPSPSQMNVSVSSPRVNFGGRATRVVDTSPVRPRSLFASTFDNANRIGLPTPNDLLDTHESDTATSDETEDAGSAVVLTALRATPRMREALGVDQTLTPVRRSLRLASNSPARQNVAQLLNNTEYAYSPNRALHEARRLAFAHKNTSSSLRSHMIKLEPQAAIIEEEVESLSDEMSGVGGETPQTPEKNTTEGGLGRFKTVTSIRTPCKQKHEQPTMMTPVRRSRRLHDQHQTKGDDTETSSNEASDKLWPNHYLMD
eukprot:TRINITY_DN7491_c0_g1_i2.p1 TRINITY_DN7491_c0_g1~~TRINITY_DN7491_c0_g1_i2.p1  ORF type:complete len:738 (-),score=140.69 TRINITY_DN7491_c0_g1_i2:54-2267(-)